MKGMLDSQRYPLNLNFINNLEYIVIFLAWQMFSFDRFLLFLNKKTWMSNLYLIRQTL